ncbi:hypothetical protein GF407_05495 [candidate division KSB1 bacterium]|nr:hypothetical protein [candidate division KSB1 bacterium]
MVNIIFSIGESVSEYHITGSNCRSNARNVFTKYRRKGLLISLYHAFIKLLQSRLEVLRAWPFAAVIGSFIATGGTPQAVPTILVFISVFFVSFSVYAYNDILDAKWDAMNAVKKKRPLPMGDVSPKEAWMLVWMTGGAGLLIALAINWQTFLLTLAYFLLFTIYSLPAIRLKKRFLCKEIVIAFAFPLLMFAGAYAVTARFSEAVLYTGLIIMFFMIMGQPAMNDIFDVKEDKKAGVRSLSILLPWKYALALWITGVCGSLLFMVLLVRFAGFDPALVWLMSPLTLLYLPVTLQLLKSAEIDNILKAKTISHVYVVFMQIFFIFTAPV